MYRMSAVCLRLFGRFDDGKQIGRAEKKAQELISDCNNVQKKEAYELVRGKISGFLEDIKKLNIEDKKNIEDTADEIREKMVSFMQKELEVLEEDAREKISSSTDEKSLQDSKVFFLGKKVN